MGSDHYYIQTKPHVKKSFSIISKMQRQVINQARKSHKLFGTAKSSERRAHQSIKEVESLRQRPVKDFATWYETCGISGETKVFLQKIGCGNTEVLNLGKDYPERLTEQFKSLDVNNLREYTVWNFDFKPGS